MVKKMFMKNFLQNKVINFALIGLASLPTAAQQKEQKPQRPNVLFIAVDDLKPVLGCYGNKLVKTPNIDRLASRGTVFMSNYVQQAISGATRASCLTGKRPDYTRVWDLVTKMRDVHPDILTIPQYFISQGYETSGIGKIYHPSCVVNNDEPSWSIPYLDEDESYAKAYGKPAFGLYQNPETKKASDKFIREAIDKGMPPREAVAQALKQIKPSIECADVADNAYKDGAVAIKAKEQLTKLVNGDKPFFFAVGFIRPHLPFVSPKKYWDLYDRKDMPVAKFQEHAKNSPLFAYHPSGELKTYSDIPALCTFSDQRDALNRTGLSVEKQKELIHGYYAAVSYTDAQVGILLNTLDSLGISDNTIIVLWGDHGWHLGDHDLWCKHTNFENATHAPLIISAPGMKSGETKSLTEHVDIFPTLCDLSGIEVPAYLDGKSLVPLMKNNNISIKDYAVSQYPRNIKKELAQKPGFNTGNVMGYSLRTTRYRYTIWMADGFRSDMPFTETKVLATELYDYKKDPSEKINVASEKAYASVTEELKNDMLAYFKSQEQKLKR